MKHAWKIETTNYNEFSLKLVSKHEKTHQVSTIFKLIQYMVSLREYPLDAARFYMIIERIHTCSSVKCILLRSDI